MIGHISFCKSHYEICQHTKEGIVTWAFLTEQPRLEKKREKERKKSESGAQMCMFCSCIF